MKYFLSVFSILIVLSSSVSAQNPVNDFVILGSQYGNQSFYSLADGEKANVTNTGWDLQFGTAQRSAAIRINDAKDIQVFVLANPDTANWNSIDTTGMIQLHNADTSWEYGAFNNVGTRMHPDYGVIYYVGTGQLKGQRIFVVKLNNGSFKKFWVKSLNYYEYTILIGDLDNSNEQTILLDKEDYGSKNFFYYDMENMQAVDLEPAAEEWDIVFRKYFAMDSVTYLPFNRVTGVLTNLNTQTAEIKGMPLNSFNNLDTDAGATYSNFINVMGFDWKKYDYDNSVYILADSLGYFVKTQLGDVYKIVFTGFSGSADGRIDFQKTFLNPVSASVEDIQNANLNMMTVYPNPSASYTNILVSMKKETDINITVLDISGKTVFAKNISATSGLNNFRLETSAFQKGFYFVKVTDGNSALTQKLLVAE